MIKPSTAAIEAAARALADAESSLPWESFDMEYVLDFRLRARAALSAAGPAMVAEELTTLANECRGASGRYSDRGEGQYALAMAHVAGWLKSRAAELRGNADENH